jgi:hypothetical protein
MRFRVIIEVHLIRTLTFALQPLQISLGPFCNGEGDDLGGVVRVVAEDQALQGWVEGCQGLDLQAILSGRLDDTLPAVEALDGEDLDTGTQPGFKDGAGQELGVAFLVGGGDDEEGV